MNAVETTKNTKDTKREGVTGISWFTRQVRFFGGPKNSFAAFVFVCFVVRLNCGFQDHKRCIQPGCIAVFQIGAGRGVSGPCEQPGALRVGGWSAGWEARDTADGEVCGTGTCADVPARFARPATGLSPRPPSLDSRAMTPTGKQPAATRGTADPGATLHRPA